MTQSTIVPAIITFFAITSFGELDVPFHNAIRLSSTTVGGIATTISVTFINEYAHFHKFDGAVITWLASSAVADIIITTSLVYTLVSIIDIIISLVLNPN